MCHFICHVILLSCPFKQIRTDKMGRKAKEMCIEVKEIMWKLLQDGKTIFHVSETLGIPKLTFTCFHNV